MDGVPDGVPRVPEQRRPDSTPTPSEPATTTVAERPVESAALRFSVLGPVRAWRGDEPVTTGSPQQRALLAALLLREGRTATAAELIDALWGEEPPSANAPSRPSPPPVSRRASPRTRRGRRAR
ncbi:hypothetical protein ABZ281_21225, partial [Streptomyces sp. NPDC006265]